MERHTRHTNRTTRASIRRPETTTSRDGSRSSAYRSSRRRSSQGSSRTRRSSQVGQARPSEYSRRNSLEHYGAKRQHVKKHHVLRIVLITAAIVVAAGGIEVAVLLGHEFASANESPCLNLVASYPFHDYAAFGKPSAYQSAGTL